MQPQVKIIKASKESKNILSSSTKQKVCAYCRVSTDNEEQMNSFQSQVSYYKSLIGENDKWEYVDVYADEAVTGTKVSSREGFQRMINDCMDGKIDIILTKSISRFARNTVDTLHYVRKLKEKNIAVIFEEEHINTLAMEGELMLTILSSVAQQEVSNTSSHVKKGLKMKLERGEMVGFNGCIGYTYDSNIQKITINEDEAKIVRFIFEKYAEGYGASTIRKELQKMNIKTKRGHDKWSDTVITGIIKNEKYIGDCLFGKTYTIDPIEKKRVKDKGQYDMVYMEGHHEPIVSKEVFKRANELLEKRSQGKKQLLEGEFLDFKGKYTFSKKVFCGFCGNVFTRRQHQQTVTTKKSTWKCYKTTKDGAIFCPDSRIVDESTLERAFMLVMQRLITADDALINKFVNRAKQALDNTLPIKSVDNIKKGIESLEVRKNKVIDLMVDGTLSKEQYQTRIDDIEKKIEEYRKELNEISLVTEKQNTLKDKLEIIKEIISNKLTIDEFDEDVFEALIKKVVVGGLDDDGNKIHHMLTFVFSEDRKTSGYKTNYIVIDSFDMPVDFYEFVKNEYGVNKKKIINSIPIRIAVENE